MKLLLALGLLLLAGTAFADELVVGERDALSISRLSLGAGAAYEWVTANGAVATPAIRHEWVARVAGAYNLTRGSNGIGRTSLIASVQWPTDTKLLRTQVGVMVTLFTGR